MKAEYVYLPAETLQQLQEIKRMIYLKMNGVTVEQMERSGVFYFKNYGVSLPEIKQLSGRYAQNRALAQALWREKIRETMLLATFLCPPAGFDESQADKWVDDVATLEIAENVSRNLLCHLAFIGAKAEEWVKSDSHWKCAVGFYCAAFGLDRFSQDQQQELLLQVRRGKHLNEMPVYRAVALFLRKLGSQDVNRAKEVLAFVGSFDPSSGRAERYIYEEVQTDLKYRFDL